MDGCNAFTYNITWNSLYKTIILTATGCFTLFDFTGWIVGINEILGNTALSHVGNTKDITNTGTELSNLIWTQLIRVSYYHCFCKDLLKTENTVKRVVVCTLKFKTEKIFHFILCDVLWYIG